MIRALENASSHLTEARRDAQTSYYPKEAIVYPMVQSLQAKKLNLQGTIQKVCHSPRREGVKPK